MDVTEKGYNFLRMVYHFGTAVTSSVVFDIMLEHTDFRKCPVIVSG